MFTRIKGSELYKVLSQKIFAKSTKENDAGEDGANTKQAAKKLSLYPDAIWRRSKSPRFRQD